MEVNPVRLLQPRRFSDDRGWFSETFKEKELQTFGIDVHFVQDNHSLSRMKGTLRGIHFQVPPHAQDKLVRCIRGRIFDIAVDLRKGSPTYGQWVGAELSADNGQQLYVPIGFGHAFVTLEPDTEVIYKVTDYYAPECDGGIRWNDPDISVAWPAALEAPALSAKDAVLPFLAEFDSPFCYNGAPLQPLDH